MRIEEEIRSLSPVAAAKAILEKNPDLQRPPIDVEKLCERQNITVKYVDFGKIEKETGAEVTGAIQKTRDNYAILVNKENCEERARFTIAHELGRYFFQALDDPRRTFVKYRWGISSPKTAANKFAVELLMPESLVRKEYSKMKIHLGLTLARQFNVSNQAMYRRLDNLELSYIGF